jgi:hypothetical protein
MIEIEEIEKNIDEVLKQITLEIYIQLFEKITKLNVTIPKVLGELNDLIQNRYPRYINKIIVRFGEKLKAIDLKINRFNEFLEEKVN